MEVWQLTDKPETYSDDRWDYCFLLIGNRFDRHQNRHPLCDRWNFDEAESRFVISLKKDT